jgi:hypothetical protein
MIVNALYPNVWRIISRAIVQVSGQYGGRVFLNTAPSEVTYPYLIYQSDSSLGTSYPMLNMSAWKGIVTLRSVSTSLAESVDSLGELVNNFNSPIPITGLANISIPYDVQFYPYKTYSFPVERINTVAIYTTAVGLETFITPR